MRRRPLPKWTTTTAWRSALGVVALVVLHASAAVQQRQQSSLSPIEEFPASWAASSAHGSAIALPFVASSQTDNNNNKKLSVPDVQDGVVILLQSKTSPYRVSSTKLDASTEYSKNLFGVRVANRPLTSSKRWTLFDQICFGTWTGYAPDIDYLNGCIWKLLDDHRFVQNTALSLSVSRLVLALAETLREECQLPLSRPFGVQGLFVGQDGRRRTASNSLHIVTLDPSGGYRHWKRGTAIGKSAHLIRQQLVECLQTNLDDVDNENNDGPSFYICDTALQALGLCLKASVQSTPTSNGEAGDFYQALVVTKSSEDVDSALCVRAIDPNQVEAIRKDIAATS